MEQATHRKLKQEMGIDLSTEFAFKFQYHAALDNNLTEHEMDHVYMGTTDVVPILNKEEAEAWKYISLPDLKKDINNNSNTYTAWFKIIVAHPEFNAIGVS